jgi:phosphate transport system protein
MAVHLAREIIKLKKMTLQQSTLVEQGVKEAFLAFSTQDVKSAEKVIYGDSAIDRMEVDLEEECLKILALHQPVALDLRYVVTCLKINNDLERIGDLAADISEQALMVVEHAMDQLPADFQVLGALAQELLRLSLNSFMEMDISMAKEIIARESEVTQIFNTIFGTITNDIKKRPAKSDFLIAILIITRYMCRIADHAINIAEDIIYMITGEIVRHQKA